MATSPPSGISDALADRYEVERELGHGGMATVFLAHDRRHGRPVALKVLRHDLGEDGARRFLSEIKTVAGLTHPYILPLYDSGEAGGHLYYVMPYVSGQTLADHIAAVGQMDLDDTLRVIDEIGDGLAHAHRNGLVHRDVKPSNIFLADGHAYLADFGIAKAVENEQTAALTATGAAIGTPLYMSPEQASGGEVDGRSDIYALGCVHYAMLTGKPPYEGPNAMAIMAAHMLDEIPTTGTHRADVPPAVENAITRALAKSPDERFSTMEEFVDAVHGQAHATARRRSSARPAARPRRRIPVWVGIVGVLVLASLVSITWSLTRPPEPSSTPGVVSDLVATRVVVAPLENVSGDASVDQIGRMGAQSITEGLHRTGIVDVVPSLTALQAWNFVADLRARADTSFSPIAALATETQAGLVISGAYYLDGDSIQYNLELTDAASGRTVDALDAVRGSRDAPGQAISELRDRVMGSLSVNLDERLADLGLAAVQPPAYASYQAFDEGMNAYIRSQWRASVDPFYRAHELDTTFVLPLLYASLSLSNVRELATVDSLTTFLDARRARLSEYHRHWLSYVAARTHGRNEEARLAIREASRLAPGSKAVYNYAYAAQLTHRPREAVTALETLDPERGPMRGWLPYWQMLTDNQHRLGEHGDELDAARRSRELHPDRGWPYIMEGQALAALGDLDAGDRIAVEVETLEFPDVGYAEILNSIATELDAHGHADEALELYGRVIQWYETESEDARAVPLNMQMYVWALDDSGRSAEALEVVRRLRVAEPDRLDLMASEAVLQVELGDRDAGEAALTLLLEAERDDPYSRGIHSLRAARIAGALGDADRAASLLRASIDQGFRPLRHPDRRLERFVGHPPFDEVMTPLDS